MRSALILGFVGVLMTLIAHLPLSWVAPKISPLSYTGSVWNGAVTDIPNFAPVRTQVSIRDLLTGQPLVTFSSRMPGLELLGRTTLGGKLSLNTKGTMDFITRVDNRLAGLEGDYALTLSDMKIRQTCLSGSGQVSTDVLARNRPKWQWAGPVLQGPVQCDEGDVVMTLTGQDAGQSVNVIIRLAVSGTYQITAVIETRESRAGLFLPLYGFQHSGTEYRLNEQGVWR